MTGLAELQRLAEVSRRGLAEWLSRQSVDWLHECDKLDSSSEWTPPPEPGSVANITISFFTLCQKWNPNHNYYATWSFEVNHPMLDREPEQISIWLTTHFEDLLNDLRAVVSEPVSLGG